MALFSDPIPTSAAVHSINGDLLSAIIIEKELVDENPGHVQYRYDLALHHINLGTSFLALGDRQRGEQHLLAAEPIQEKLAEEFPHDHLHNASLLLRSQRLRQ